MFCLRNQFVTGDSFVLASSSRPGRLPPALLSVGLPGTHFFGHATAIVSLNSDDFSTYELSTGLSLESDIRKDALL